MRCQQSPGIRRRIVAAVGMALRSGRRRLREHRPRPLLAMIGVPLAVAAVLLENQPAAAIPLAGLAWWWAPTGWDWYWLSAVGRGVITTIWAMLGASALHAFPDELPGIAALWIGSAVTLGLVAVVSDRGLWRATPSVGAGSVPMGRATPVRR